MSDERKPVICPCGNEMHFGCTERAAMCGEAPWAGMYICRCGWSSPYREGDTPIDCERNAYLAATRRPPNKPLADDAVMALPDGAAVWRRFDGRSVCMVSGKRAKELLRYGCANITIWMLNPTPADIEAARKERSADTQ